jgi:hypothetical protein
MTTPDEVPAEAQQQIRHAVDTALASPGEAKGFLSNIPDLSGAAGIKDKALSAITGILGAIDTIQAYAWIIPAKYHDPIQKLEDALKKVQGWLD